MNTKIRAAASCSAALALAAWVPAQAETKPPPTPPNAVDADTKLPAPMPASSAPTPKTGGDCRLADARPEPSTKPRLLKPNGSALRAARPGGEVVFGPAADGLWAGGDTYKVGFTDDGVVFVPYFGAKAARSYPVILRVSAFGSLPVDTRPGPVQLASTVRFTHGSIGEIYRLSADHMEQLFEIDAWWGSELSVQMTVASDMNATQTDAGVRFTSPYGSVLYGNATLVDARGQRHQMATRLDGDRIVLSISVEGIPFPVTIDPIVKTFVAVSTPAPIVGHPDVAFGLGQNQYLVVYELFASATDTDVYTVAVDGRGNPVAGSLRAIDTSLDDWRTPRIAYNRIADNFLVVAAVRQPPTVNREIWSRTVAAATYAVGPAVRVSGTEAGDKYSPDVGGDFYMVPPTYYTVVWQRQLTTSDSDIHFRQVQSDGVPRGSTVQVIDNSTANDFRPRIAKCDGAGVSALQVWPVVWHRDVGTHSDIYGARLSWDGVVTTPPFAIDTTLDDDTNASVSSPTETQGRDRFWTVAYQTAAIGNLDVFLRRYRDGPAPTMVGLDFLADVEGLDPMERMRHQLLPQIDTDGCRFAVTYVEEYSLVDWDVWVSTVHPRVGGFAASERRLALDQSTEFSGSVSVVAAHSGGGMVADYAAVWDAQTTSGPPLGEIRGAAFQGIRPGGGYAVRNTGCAGLTLGYATIQPALGAPLSFAVGGTAQPRFIMFSVPAPARPICAQGCQLGVHPALMITFGQAALNLVIPCDPALLDGTVAFQGGAVGVPGGCPSLANLALTDTVDVQIR